MLKKKLFSFALILFLGFGLVFYSENTKASQLDGEQKISEVFPDPVFSKYIATRLGKTIEETVVQSELDNIPNVSITGTALKSIEGMQYLNYATDFVLHSNQITDLSPFASWEALGLNATTNTPIWHLWLTGNPITDLTPLTNWHITIYDLYLHQIPIGNDQIENLKMIDQNNTIIRYSFGWNQIDNFAPLSDTFVSRLWGYNDLTNYGHTIDLGTKYVQDNQDLTVINPSVWFDGTTMTVASATNNGQINPIDQSVTWSELNQEKPENIYFTVAGTRTSVTYTIHLEYLTTGKPVTIQYIDESGQSISDDEVFTGNVGEAFDFEPKFINSYQFLEVQGNPQGAYSEDEQTITFVYKKNKISADVTVNYLDETGQSILPSEIFSGEFGDPYQIIPKDIENYQFKEVVGNSLGHFSEKPQVVNFIYQKITIETNENHDQSLISGDEQNNSVLPKNEDMNQVSLKTKNTQKVLPNTSEEIVGRWAMTIVGFELLGIAFLLVQKKSVENKSN